MNCPAFTFSPMQNYVHLRCYAGYSAIGAAHRVLASMAFRCLNLDEDAALAYLMNAEQRAGEELARRREWWESILVDRKLSALDWQGSGI